MNKKLLVIFTILYVAFEFFFERQSMYTLFLWGIVAGMYSDWRYGSRDRANKYLYLVVFLIFCYLSTFIGSNAYKGFTETLYVFRCFVPIIVYDVVRGVDLKAKKLIVFFCLIFILLYAFKANAILEMVGSENGLREISSQHDEDYVSTAFAYIYSLPILICSLVIAIKLIIQDRIRFKYPSWILIALIILIIVYLSSLIIKSLFVTAMLFTVIGITIALLYKRGEKEKKWIFKSGVAVSFIIVLFIFNFNSIVDFASRNGNEGTVMRMYEIRMSLSGQSKSTVDLAERNDLREVSIQTFFNNPIVGVHHKMVGTVNEAVVGNHSQWIDDLAKFGLFAILIFVFIYKSLVQQYKDTKIVIPIIVFVVLGFFNPIMYPIVSIVSFVICPLVFDIIIRLKNDV